MDDNDYNFPLLKRRTQWLLVAIASLLVLFTPIYLAIQSYTPYIIRPLSLNLQSTAIGLNCLLVPLLVTIVLATRMEAKRRNPTVNQTVLGELLIGIFGIIVLLLTWFVFASDRFYAVTNAELNTHRYELLTRITRSDDGSSSDLFLALYQCDAFAFTCQFVDESSPLSDLNIYSNPETAKLVPNSELNTLVVVIDSKTLYTYTPE